MRVHARAIVRAEPLRGGLDDGSGIACRAIHAVRVLGPFGHGRAGHGTIARDGARSVRGRATHRVERDGSSCRSCSRHGASRHFTEVGVIIAHVSEIRAGNFTEARDLLG